MVSKTRRSHAVSALLSHRSRRSPFLSHKSNCFPSSTFMIAPRSTSMGYSASVHPPGKSHTSELHSLLIYALNLSVVCPCELSRVSSDSSAGTPPRPFIRLWRKQFITHAMQNSLSAHPFFWKKTSTRGSYDFVSRFKIPPSDFNSTRAVRSRKASWDKLIAADSHQRESNATMRCVSRYFYPLLQGSAGTLGSTPPTTALILSAAEKKKKMMLQYKFVCVFFWRT